MSNRLNAILALYALLAFSGCGQPADEDPKEQAPSTASVRQALSGGQETTSRYLVTAATGTYTVLSTTDTAVHQCNLTGSGGAAPLDDGYALLSLGFTFSFYNAPYTDVYVSANGFIKFGAAPTPSSFINRDVIDTLTEQSSIFAWWGDMILPAQSACLYKHDTTSSPSRFIIEWKDLRNYTNDTGHLGPISHDVEVVLYEGSNDIETLHNPATIVFGTGTIPRLWTTSDTSLSQASMGISDEANDGSPSADTRPHNCTYTYSCDESVEYNLQNHGYRYSRPPFVYISPVTSTISYTPDTSGMQVLPPGGDVDDGNAYIDFPEPFVFWGTVYYGAYVSVNGFISFDPTPGAWYGNSSLPNTSQPNNIIMGWWDDMILADIGDLTYRTHAPCMDCTPDQIIFEWNNWRHYDDTQPGNVGTTQHQMRIILHLFDSRVEVQYGSVSATTSADSATVAIENPDGSYFLSPSLPAVLPATLPTPLPCNGNCTESDWQTNLTNKSIIYTKPTWAYLYNKYFTQFGTNTLHCGYCHELFMNSTHDGFLDQNATYTALFSPIENRLEPTMSPPPRTCPSSPGTWEPYAPDPYMGTANLLTQHTDGRVDPLSLLMSPEYSQIQWFNGNEPNMPFDCTTFPPIPSTYSQGVNELQTWLADGAPGP